MIRSRSFCPWHCCTVTQQPLPVARGGSTARSPTADSGRDLHLGDSFSKAASLEPLCSARSGAGRRRMAGSESNRRAGARFMQDSRPIVVQIRCFEIALAAGECVCFEDGGGREGMLQIWCAVLGRVYEYGISGEASKTGSSNLYVLQHDRALAPLGPSRTVKVHVKPEGDRVAPRQLSQGIPPNQAERLGPSDHVWGNCPCGTWLRI